MSVRLIAVAIPQETRLLASSAPTMSPKLHGMTTESQRVVVVGYVHCRMTYNEVTRTLGYKSDGTLHYTWNQVKGAYDYLEFCDASTVYAIWGPTWKTANVRGRIDQQTLDMKKHLEREGLRRAKYAEKLAALKKEEKAYRKTVWKRIRHHHCEGN